jgi:DNA-binding transcriptional regulator YiaG
MNVKKKYQSEISMIVHQDAEGMYQLGIIDDARMREFDKDCLVQEPEAAKETTKMEHIPVTAEI